jgi:hypothetical protein
MAFYTGFSLQLDARYINQGSILGPLLFNKYIYMILQLKFQNWKQFSLATIQLFS